MPIKKGRWKGSGKGVPGGIGPIGSPRSTDAVIRERRCPAKTPVKIPVTISSSGVALSLKSVEGEGEGFIVIVVVIVIGFGWYHYRCLQAPPPSIEFPAIELLHTPLPELPSPQGCLSASFLFVISSRPVINRHQPSLYPTIGKKRKSVGVRVFTIEVVDHVTC